MKKAEIVLKNITKDLTKNKDVVTTIKISKVGIEAMKWLSKRWGMSNKRLFDSLLKGENEGMLKIITKMKNESNINLIKKSLRVSIRSIENLNEMSKKYGIPRDLIIDRCFIILKLLVEEQLNSIKSKHEKALKMINQYWYKGDELEKDLKKLLDKDDPIIYRFGKINVLSMNLSMAISDELENGTLIDPDNSAQ